MTTQEGSTAKLILIVDDEPEIRELLVAGFKSRGFRTVEAENGRAAYDLFVQQKADVVISDVRMPGGDGIELLARIRATDSQVPVFLVTGFSELASEDAVRKGAEALFSKPFSRKTLIEAVLNALKRSPAPPRGK